MKKCRRMAFPILFLLGLALGFYLPGMSTEPPSEEPPEAIHMTARKYRFDPKIITVRKGRLVRLIIKAEDRDHGFKLEAFDINQRLVKGVLTTIEFTADKAGTFPFKCSVRCGWSHGKMKGTLVVEVEENSP